MTAPPVAIVATSGGLRSARTAALRTLVVGTAPIAAAAVSDGRITTLEECAPSDLDALFVGEVAR